MIAYGTAILKKKNGRVLDVDLANSKEEAEELVSRMNAKDLGAAVTWAVVEINVLPSEELPYIGDMK